jgi:light-regulated signal transduction histidine kinase (bacteriophytochrome)
VQYVGDGYYNWFTNVCSKLNDGLVILYYDISDRKVAEMKISELNTALANSNTDLERLVEERTAQLHRVNQELVFTNQQFQETNKELEAFSYSVSHDLRAPLRSVNGFAEMLRERYKDQFDEEGLRLLGRITNGAQKMGILIDELLALSRLGRKALQISDVNMTEIVHSVLEELNTHNELADYSIEISALPNAACDTALLRQVWVNLLSNAVKYSRHSASKSISITFFMQNGTPVYAVRDQGVGFDMRYADKLFNVFQRLHKERDFEGTGIGLAIVKRIITKHGGQVWAEAEINNGATFFFSLLNLSSRNIP